MKNFTHMLPVLLGLIIFHSNPAHSSEKMRDMSLSVEDTNSQFASPPKSRKAIDDPGFYNDTNRNSYYDYDDDNSYNGNNNFSFDANTPINPNMINNMANPVDNFSQNNTMNNTMNGRRPPPPLRGGQQGFINKFCSQDYSPRNVSSEAQQSCMDTQRQEACERFANAAVNIQRLLSQTIDCDANSLGYGSSGCDGLDASRLDMLKQYWQDEDTSYTILYLPDMVLNSAANCEATTRRSTMR